MLGTAPAQSSMEVGVGLKALLVYPEMPPTYWSLRYALPFIGKKAVFPPPWVCSPWPLCCRRPSSPPSWT
jgi:hypothetical protein